MKFHREISSVNPDKCKMIARNFLGFKVGSVSHYFSGGRDWYSVIVRGEQRGSATDFYHACDMLLNDLGVIKTNCV